MDKNTNTPTGPAYRPGQPGAQDETPVGVARGAGGAKISPSEPRAAPAGTDAEASGERTSATQNIVNLELHRGSVGTDPDRTEAGGYEGRDESQVSPIVPFVMIGTIVVMAIVVMTVIYVQS